MQTMTECDVCTDGKVVCVCVCVCGGGGGEIVGLVTMLTGSDVSCSGRPCRR